MNLYEFFIGFRYLRSKKTQGFISFNTFLSIFIVFLGVFILIVVMSVFNGFQAMIKDSILDVDSHVTVNKFVVKSEFNGFKNYNEIIDRIKTLDNITYVSPYYQGQGLLRTGNLIEPVFIRGIGEKGNIPEDLLKFIDLKKYPSKFSDKKEVFIGEELAKYQDIAIGDYLEIIVSKGKSGSRIDVVPNIARFEVIGYFKTGYYEFDTKLIMMSLDQAQKLYAVKGYVNGIGIKIDDIFLIKKKSIEISELIGFDFNVFTAEQKNENLFYALEMEKLIMTIILFLVIISAAFTIMGTLVMVVMEKRKAVGILKAIGARPISIMTIFILEGFFIGLLGTLSGIVCGLVVALNLHDIIKFIELKLNTTMAYLYEEMSKGIWVDIELVPTSIYYIEGIPTEIRPEFIVFIAISAIFIATVSAVFPAWYASRLNPVQTIRYE